MSKEILIIVCETTWEDLSRVMMKENFDVFFAGDD
jgi:hypothetical protein